MARFTDLLDSIGFGDDGLTRAYPETFHDDAVTAYNEDMAAPAAKIAVLEADLAEALAKIQALQAHNYELITSQPGEDKEPADDSTSDESDESDVTTDDLFEDKE